MAFFFVSVSISTALAYIAQKQKESNKSSKVAVFLLIAFLVFLSGFRYMSYVQSDEWIYRTGCDALKNTALKIEGGEWLFYILNWICANFLGGSQMLIFLTALITNTSLILFFKKYSYSFWLTVFLYVGSGSFMASMNIIRQYLALAVVIWCYPLAANRKLLKYIILVVIGGFIHTSAWLMLPLYFVFRQRKSTSLMALVILGFLIVITQFENIMTAILPHTSYDNYLDDILNAGYGMKLIRALAWAVPLVLILVFKNFFTGKYNVELAYIYAAAFGLGIYIIAIQYVYVARFDLYFILPALTLFGLIPRAFSKGFRDFVQFGMVALFFAYGLYQATINPVYHNIVFEGLKPF